MRLKTYVKCPVLFFKSPQTLSNLFRYTSIVFFSLTKSPYKWGRDTRGGARTILSATIIFRSMYGTRIHNYDSKLYINLYTLSTYYVCICSIYIYIYTYIFNVLYKVKHAHYKLIFTNVLLSVIDFNDSFY